MSSYSPQYIQFMNYQLHPVQIPILFSDIS